MQVKSLKISTLVERVLKLAAYLYENHLYYENSGFGVTLPFIYGKIRGTNIINRGVWYGVTFSENY